MKGAARHAVAADTVFDGATAHPDHVVVIEAGTITALMPRRELPRGLPVQELPDGAGLTPGFIDVQVNGGGDVLFNATPTIDGIAAIVAAHRRFGTTALLPTLISDTSDKMQAAAAGRPPSFRSRASSGFISRGRSCRERAGVHDPAMLRPPTRRSDVSTAPHSVCGW
jgi:N-acetylglucosamine-6-phosphate deacetylase